MPGFIQGIWILMHLIPDSIVKFLVDYEELDLVVQWDIITFSRSRFVGV